MVDYPLSHPFLKTVLPKLCQLIHDKVERNRLAVVDLLLKVKRLRAIKVHINNFSKDIKTRWKSCIECRCNYSYEGSYRRC